MSKQPGVVPKLMRPFAVVALAACASRSVGGPADVRLPSGEHEGYRIVRCKIDGEIAVVGTGKRTFDWATRDQMASGEILPPAQRFRREVIGVVVPPHAYRGDGFGAGCAGTGGAAFRIWTSSWREVGPIAERAGAWLARRDLGGEIVIGVMGEIHPL